MNRIKLWVFPFITALILVIILRLYLYSFYVVQSNSMNNTLIINEKVLIQKFGKIRKNSIVLIHKGDSSFLSRCVGTAYDTLRIYKGILYVNNHKFEYSKYPVSKISEPYILKTDSFIMNKILDKAEFNPYFALFGVYHINTDSATLHKLLKTSYWKSIKKIQNKISLYDDRINRFVNRLYWNADNTGEIVIPAKGMKIKLTPYKYELYKKIIEQETGKELKRNGNKIFMNDKLLKSYIFRQNYYFLVNDNRSNTSDSRYNGFINEKQISGKVILKLP